MALTRIGNQAITLDAAEIPNLDAAKITTGTLANARIAEASVTQHVTATDLQPLKSDLSALALREATNEASAAFNLPNQFIETFTDDTNLGTQTDGDRNNGYWATIYSALTAQPFYRTSSDEWDFTTAASSNGTNSSGYTFVAWLKTINGTSWDTDGSTGGALIDLATTHSSFGTFIGTQYSSSVSDDKMAFHEPGHNGAVTASKLDDTASKTDWVLMAWRHDAGAYQHATGMQLINPASSYGTKTAMSSGSGSISVFHDIANGGDACLFASPVTQSRSGKGSVDYSQTFMNKDVAAIGYWNEPLTDAEIIALANGGELFDWTGNSGNYTSSANLIDYFKIYDSNNTTTMINSGTGTRNAVKQTGSGSWQSSGGLEKLATAINATGTLIQSANAVGSAKTKVGGTMLYKDNAGTATLGTDLKIYFTCDGGSNWTEAASYNAITPVYSTGIKQVRLGETTCTSGTDVRYKAVWANQASGSKETQLHGIGVNY